MEKGDVFGEWTVIEEVERDPNNGMRRFLCRCSCGKEKVVRKDKLESGRSRSCGHVDHSLDRILSGKATGASGVRGVCWKEKDGRWEAYLTYKGVRKYLGQYESKEDAIQARLSAENELKKS